jgi:hypothetical protein
VKKVVWRLVSIAIAVVVYELLGWTLDSQGVGAVLLSSGAHTPVLALLATALLAVLRFVLIVIAPSLWAWELVSFAFAVQAQRAQRLTNTLSSSPETTTI